MKGWICIAELMRNTRLHAEKYEGKNNVNLLKDDKAKNISKI